MFRKVFFVVVLWQFCDGQMYHPYTMIKTNPAVIMFPTYEELPRPRPYVIAQNNENRGPTRPTVKPDREGFVPMTTNRPQFKPYRESFAPITSRPIQKIPPAYNPHAELIDNSSLPIPLDFLQKLNAFDDVNDLMINFVEGDDSEVPELGNRFGEDDDGERNSAVTPKSAACMPELQTVKLVPNNDPSVYYIPSCTRIERCGGCCGSELLSCQPSATEKVNFKVFKTQFGGGDKLSLKNKEIVVVERHTKCKCGCRIQPEDCSDLQEYRKSQCKCVCSNTDKQKKCKKNVEIMIWNPHTCTCECRNEQSCTTGYVFDPNTCACVQVPERRRFADFSRREGVKRVSVKN